jgi:hypothetical protein
MYKCRKCDREFTTPQGRGKHEKLCGYSKINIDHGYEYIIGSDGKALFIHRKVVEDKIGRKLLSSEIVHHEDEHKRNNDPSNLSLTNTKDHGKHHYKSIPKRKTLPIGSNNGNAKLTEEHVKIIKEQLKNGIHENILSKEYNVSFDTIWDIKKERTWKHVIV